MTDAYWISAAVTWATVSVGLLLRFMRNILVKQHGMEAVDRAIGHSERITGELFEFAKMMQEQIEENRNREVQEQVDTRNQLANLAKDIADRIAENHQKERVTASTDGQDDEPEDGVLDMLRSDRIP